MGRCEGTWNSTVVLASTGASKGDGTLVIDTEDGSGNITGSHNGALRNGRCVNGHVTYRIDTLNGGHCIYDGDVDTGGNTINGTKTCHNPHFSDGEDGTWTAEKTGGGGGEDEDKKSKRPRT